MLYNRELSSKKNKEFIEKFNIDVYNLNIDKLFNIAENGELEDFRLLCNSFWYNALDPGHYIDYPNIRETLLKIKSKCEERIDKLFEGNMLDLINAIHNTDHDVYYFDKIAFFIYNKPIKPYRRMMIVSLIIIHDFIGKELNTSDMKNLIRILSPDNFYLDNYDIYGVISHPHEVIYEEQKISTDAWIEFTDQIFYRNYNAAYDVLTKYNKMRLEKDNEISRNL